MEPPLSGPLLSGPLLSGPLLSGPLLSGPLLSGQPQIGHVACSLLTIMKFGLDENTRREPKGCCLPVWWLVYSTTNNYHLVAR